MPKAFETGHTFFPQTDELFWSESLRKEFTDEYKQAHSLQPPRGPGRALQHDWTLARRGSPDIPMLGTEMGRLPFGRQRRLGQLGTSLSSTSYGSFWNDPLFSQKEFPLPPVSSSGNGKTSSSDIGCYWEHSDLFGKPKPVTNAFNRKAVRCNNSSTLVCSSTRMNVPMLPLPD
eukprot:6209911-Pleurochrysis_carterae.AAC.1